MRVKIKRNILLFAVAAIMIFSLYALPNQVRADPPPDPPGPTLPIVFCFRITDINQVSGDPEGDKFTFEFEVLNWSDTDADGVEMILAKPARGNVFISGADVDSNGRPLLFVDVDGDGNVTDPPGAEDLEDTNGNGVLDPGEDLNGNGRLDNDSIPGNQNISNDWSVTDQTPTKVTWSAPNAASAVTFRDLLGATTTQQANQLIPHFPPDTQGPLGETTIDNIGDVTPKEAIDDGENVRDGFTITLDDFDDGDTVTFNWRLTSGGNPIGTASSGNAYGFGTLSIARINGGGLPGPIFVPNTGFGQSAVEFYDSVFLVNPEFGAEFGANIWADLIEALVGDPSLVNVRETSDSTGIFTGSLELTTDDDDGHSPTIGSALFDVGKTVFVEIAPNCGIFECILELDFSSSQFPSFSDAAVTVDSSGNFNASGLGTLPGFPDFSPVNVEINFSFDPTTSQISGTMTTICTLCPDSNGNGLADPIVQSFTAKQDVFIVDLDFAVNTC